MEGFRHLLKKQRDFFLTGKTKEVSYRIEALTSLGDMIRSHETEIMAALKKDLNKSDFDSYISEMGILLEEIRFTLFSAGRKSHCSSASVLWENVRIAVPFKSRGRSKTMMLLSPSPSTSRFN